MKVQVTFYGGLKQQIGARQQIVDLAHDAITVGDFAQALIERYPHLRLDAVAYAVNNELVAPDYVLHDGDRADLLPPVSGG